VATDSDGDRLDQTAIQPLGRSLYLGGALPMLSSGNGTCC